VNRNAPDFRMREYARRLLNCEEAASTQDEPDTPALSRVFDALRQSLGTIIGTNGFSVLLARALTLAKSEIPSLGELKVKADGSLEGLREHFNSEGSEPGVVLIAWLLALLDTFIGESLTLQILLDVWPDSALSNASALSNNVPSGESEHDPTR
jgi:hypothetical protein